MFFQMLQEAEWPMILLSVLDSTNLHGGFLEGVTTPGSPIDAKTSRTNVWRSKVGAIQVCVIDTVRGSSKPPATSIGLATSKR